MRRWWSCAGTVLLAVSLLHPIHPPAAHADEGAEPVPEQVGSMLDFEDGQLAGTVAGAPAASGPGSIVVDEFDGNRVLRVHPPDSGGASFWWSLPLDGGTYDLTGKDLVELEFDWWVEMTRPNANSLDVRLMDGDQQVLTLRTAGKGTAVNSPAGVSFYTGNAAPGNAPENGSLVEAAGSVPRLTRLHVRLDIDLLLQTAEIELTDGGTALYATAAPVPIPSGRITALQAGASRASGQNWARFNAADGVEWDEALESHYGMRLDNLVIRAAASGRTKPDIPPTQVTIAPADGARLEYGPGALPERRAAIFQAAVEPVNATNKNVVWSISDESVAGIEVHEDRRVTVTAKGEGTAYLKAVTEAVYGVEAQVPIQVVYIPEAEEPAPDFTDLLKDGYDLKFGSVFSGDDPAPLWIFAGGTYHSLAREDAPRVNHYFRFDASGSGNRGGKGDLPAAISGSKVYVHFDWKVPAVTTHQNTFNISLQDGDQVLVSLRTGTRSGERTIGAFAGPLPGPTGPDPENFWRSERYHPFAYNAVETWYTVGIELDFEQMLATVSLRPRDDESAEPSVVTFPFEGSKISSFVLTGERASQNNINITDNGIDNLFFFSKPLSGKTVVEVLPYPFLRTKPELADDNFKQSWFKTVRIGEVADEDGLALPETVQVRLADGSVAEVGVEWKLTEVPWSMAKLGQPLQYDPNRQGVFTYEGTLREVPGEAVNPMKIKTKLYVENRPGQRMTDAPWSMERLDRGVAAVPVKDGAGVLVQWRLLATEYEDAPRFHVYRNGERIPAEPVSRLNFIDPDGKPGDRYAVEKVGGERSPETPAWSGNYLDIPLQRPKDRPNPALAYGAASDADPISYTANDLSVADVDGDGRYEILVKWYPSQAQDPGLPNRHTGETIFDLYTLDGKLLWRLNLGINIVSSAHHSPFHFYDLDQDGKAELAIKTADGTRVYRPKADGTIDDLADEPVWVIGNPDAVWVGGLQNPALGGQVNNTALGRVASGPEYFTVFDGLTGEPLKTVDYFAPYNIMPDWGDQNNNRSDRFNGAVAYMPKNGVPGAEPYPTVIEVRGHYGPHFAAAYQWLDGDIVKIWEFRLAEWNAGSNQGNHNVKTADLDADGYGEVVLGAIALDHDGSVMWSSTGTRGTVIAGHGDALHVAAMLPDEAEVYVFQPHEKGPPDNVTLVRGSSGEPVWTYSANLGDVGRGVAANVTPLPGYEIWAIRTPMYNVKSGKVITGDTGDIGAMNKAPVNFVLYWDGDLLHEFFDGPDNLTVADPPVISKFVYDTETGGSSLEIVQVLEGTYSNNGTKANPGLIADILGDWRDEVLVRTADQDHLRIYVTDIPTEHVIYTLMHDPQYRMAISAQNAMYNQPAHPGIYLGEDIRDKVAQLQLPVPHIKLTLNPEAPEEPAEPEEPGQPQEPGEPEEPGQPNEPGQPSPNPPIPPYLPIWPADQGAVDPSRFVLDAGQLPEAEGGRRVVELPEEAEMLVLRADLVPALGDETLVVRIDHAIELELDARTIAALLQPDEGKPSDGSELRIAWQRTDVDEIRSDVEQAANEMEGQAAVRPVSAAYSFSWSLAGDNRKAEDLPAWDPPVRLSMRIPDGADPDLAGLYRIGEDGRLTYVGGTVRDGVVTANVSRPGTYVVLEYERIYEDVAESYWAYQAIRTLSARHVVQGVSADRFDPAGPLTRAQLIALVVRAAGLQAKLSAPSAFDDVADDAWYADAIAAAFEAGIVRGKGPNNFAPDDPVTREEEAVILLRAYLHVTGRTPPAAGEDEAFRDEDRISGWAKEAVHQARAAGLLRGRGDGNFDPGAVLTRAEGARIILNLMESLSR